ncbi:MAG: methyltransferase domain-containing protein [Gammaproteobacteria bacterium]|nr:methyltransferase domain-containing protein [Gammaproteobacteria bacterium]
MNQLLVALLLVVLAAAVFLIWRFASRRHEIPCPSWLSWLVELDNPLAKTNRSAFIIEQLGLEPDMTVLDAGCGPGRLTVPIASKLGTRGRVLAVDIQQGMLDRVAEKVTRLKLDNVDYVLAALGEGKLPVATFDRALLVAVLGEIPDRESAFSELFKALKPGGLLAVAELVFDPHYQSRKTVTRLTEEAGFRERSFFGNRLSYLLLLEKPAKSPA